MRFLIEGCRDLTALIRELSTGLRKLTIDENMDAFVVEDLVIPANSEVSVGNKLTFIPKHYIITTQKGNALITKGDTEWTRSTLYLKNNDNSNEATVNVVFILR